MRDSQRSKVYAWERKHVHFETAQPRLSLDEIRTIVGKIWCDVFGPTSPPPDIYDGRGCRKACGGAFHLILPRWAHTATTTMHELGHAIVARRWTIVGGEVRTGHGPTFVRVFCELLAYYYPGTFRLGTLLKSARACRIKVASRDAGLRPMFARRRESSTMAREVFAERIDAGNIRLKIGSGKSAETKPQVFRFTDEDVDNILRALAKEGD